MSGFSVADVVPKGTDSAGMLIDTVYSKVSGTYAIYRTAERVVVQYSDDDRLATEQRRALAPLNPVRGEINGLIDGWRKSEDEEKQAKAKIFDRRAADALNVALQGDQPHALDLLNALKIDVIAERTSVARTQYVVVASLTVVVLIVALSLASVANLPDTVRDFAEKSSLWPAASIGAIGALFSIALAIRGRQILTDLQSRDNTIDAILRVMIGAVSAVVLFSLMRGSFVNFGFGGDPISVDKMETWPNAAIVVAFVAGFSERLVGDFLNQAVLSASGRSRSNPLAGETLAPPSGMASAQNADERNPLGKSTPPLGPGDRTASGPAGAVDGDDEDCCVAGEHIGEDEMTHDVELPAASGGVASP